MNFADLSPKQRELMYLLLDEEELQEAPAGFVSHGELDEAPLSFAQQRLWFLNQMEPDSAAFNIAGPCRLKGRLNLEALQRAIAEIVRRHQVLRARFFVKSGDVTQRFASPAPIEMPLVDLSGCPPERRLAKAQEECRIRSQEPFDLEAGPLFRFFVYRLDEQDHLLLLVMHHIVADGWSIGVLTSELAAFYEAFSEDLPPQLPKLKAHYADYAIWQRNALTSAAIDRQLEYWRKQLAGPIPVIELPIDRPRPPLQTFRGSSEPLAIGQGLPERLRELTRKENATLFMILLAAFDILLWRYTGQEDMLVGTPVAGRNRPETEPLIGLFLNNLVLRADMTGNPSFREFLCRVRQTCLDSFDHQDVPFERLVELVQTQRDLSRSPLFQVMFILQVPSKPLAIPGLSLAPATVPLEQTKYELTFFLWEHKDRIEGSIEYNTDLFEAETIRRMGAHYVTLLESIAENVEERISALPLIRELERERITRQWNQTERLIPVDERLDRLFVAQVQTSPDKVAVCFEGQSMTYQDLDAASNCLAHYLSKRGIGPESLVAVCMERSLHILTVLLGVAKAGAAYLPLDPAYPVERIDYMLDDSGARALITEKALQSSFDQGGRQVIVIDEDWPEIAAESTARLESGAGLDNAAYVIYTSGSTGKPKGVVITQRSLVNFISSMRHAPGFTSADKILAVTTLSFDIAGLELWLPLAAGGSVEIAGRAASLDAFRLAHMIEDGVTVMQATPATWRLLLSAGWRGKPDLRILCGGEALPRDLADQLLERSAELWNMYGPTETTVWSTIDRVEKSGPILIGRPIDNTTVYVLDAIGAPAPVGAIGELWIGGAGVARGYLNRLELTADRFLDDPFSVHPGSRMYKTGDLARFRADGRLECLGRSDGQVKIRGYRIETGEIEVALRALPDVRESAVVARTDGLGEDKLVAYLAGGSQISASEGQLRSALKRTLPEYMIPACFVFLDRLPLTPNGKVDRRALPAPEHVETTKPTAEPPQSDMERHIAEVWSEVLGKRAIGRNANFFDLGGHSLLLAKTHVLLEERLEREIGIIELFRFPTVSSLSAHLASSSDGARLGSRPRISRRAAAAVGRQSAASV